MILRNLPAVLVVFCTVALVWADTDEDDITIDQQLALAALAAESTAQVEFTLKYDEGDPPRSAGNSQHMLAGYVRQERPLILHGYALSETEVIVGDPMIYPKSVESIHVRDGDKTIPAEISSYVIGAKQIILKLSEPLTSVKPVQFDSSLEGPYLVIATFWKNGEWMYRIKEFSQRPVLTTSGKKYLHADKGLVVDYQGKPVGYSAGNVLATDGSWKDSPLDWPAISASQMANLTEKIAQIVSKGVLRVRLSFRSPKKTSARYRPEEETETEKDALALLVDDKTLLVMVRMNPKQTARLARIEVFRPGTDPVEAEFAHTLKDFGAFLATLDTPVEGALQASQVPISEHLDKVLISAQLTVVGQEYTKRYLHSRVTSVSQGWKSRLYPTATVLDGNCLLFTEDGLLAALPATRRLPGYSGRSSYSGYSGRSSRSRWESERGRLTPSAYLWELMDDIASHADASNVPLSEEDENRLAWLGVELQPLNEELARANNVSDQTNGGSTGAMVSFIYLGSPAAEAGIEVGDIFLRLHVAGVPKPIAIEVDNGNAFQGGAFPWDRLDEVPEEFLDRIPKPWPDAENKFSRMLTDLGFGKNLSAEFSRDGEILIKEFSITQGPSHYGSAPKFKSKPLGLTVRDMTYEVRRYFQKTPDDPGVIISKIEPGSKVSVAGLKPYEIITHVNDQPVKTAEQFGKLIEANPELRLEIKRMNDGRLVKVKQSVEAEVEAPTTQQATVVSGD